MAEGHELAYCICTSGEAGEAPSDVSRTLVPALREGEQRAAAAVLGVTDVTFLGHADGRLQATLNLRRDISRVIRRFRPDRVVSQSPTRVWERVYASHPDHLAAGEATMAAVYPDARNAYAHAELLAEGLQPWTVAELYVMGLGGSGVEPVFVDITDTWTRRCWPCEPTPARPARCPTSRSASGRGGAWWPRPATPRGPPGRGLRPGRHPLILGSRRRPAGHPPQVASAG